MRAHGSSALIRPLEISRGMSRSHLFSLCMILTAGVVVARYSETRFEPNLVTIIVLCGLLIPALAVFFKAFEPIHLSCDSRLQHKSVYRRCILIGACAALVAGFSWIAVTNHFVTPYKNLLNLGGLAMLGMAYGWGVSFVVLSRSRKKIRAQEHDSKLQDIADNTVRVGSLDEDCY